MRGINSFFILSGDSSGGSARYTSLGSVRRALPTQSTRVTAHPRGSPSHATEISLAVQWRKQVNMYNDKNKTAQSLPQGVHDEDAAFKGWQRTGSGDVFPLYNITAEGHPLRGSTVTDKTLQKLNLQVPEAPPPEEPPDSTIR